MSELNWLNLGSSVPGYPARALMHAHTHTHRRASKNQYDPIKLFAGTLLIEIVTCADVLGDKVISRTDDENI